RVGELSEPSARSDRHAPAPCSVPARPTGQRRRPIPASLFSCAAFSGPLDPSRSDGGEGSGQATCLRPPRRSPHLLTSDAPALQFPPRRSTSLLFSLPRWERVGIRAFICRLPFSSFRCSASLPPYSASRAPRTTLARLALLDQAGPTGVDSLGGPSPSRG